MSAPAAKDIQGIGDEIAADKPKAASAFVVQLLQRCQSLANAPEGYGLRPEFGVAVRGVTVPPYVILYRVRPRDILILGVRHGARQPVVFK
ncbi:type II toxin-antitoxin system RelE/ParE family toxin [Caulobacter sp. RL271]|uniref:Type II toxin-antitoxin system RelE/ParE family toxin n=1 Tax=Caulobacter segnis TaxID=88688 RepID=A0ABY4ZVW9_9CAUL|nr:type II toxin-antitoxin system RelE/ParE family toxin [Caulobacter segnis]USQ96967.1 type II toxin-antitoxin system RelE/ParE family toxin [Caulobacter segnis]